MTLLSSVRVRPHTETPSDIGETAMIAIPPTPDDDSDAGATLLYGIFSWNGRDWEHEETGKGPGYPVYWWISECELLAPLDAAINNPKGGS